MGKSVRVVPKNRENSMFWVIAKKQEKTKLVKTVFGHQKTIKTVCFCVARKNNENVLHI